MHKFRELLKEERNYSLVWYHGDSKEICEDIVENGITFTNTIGRNKWGSGFYCTTLKDVKGNYDRGGILKITLKNLDNILIGETDSLIFHHFGKKAYGYFERGDTDELGETINNWLQKHKKINGILYEDQNILLLINSKNISKIENASL